MTNEDILYAPIDDNPQPQKKGIGCTDRDIIMYLVSRYRDGASPSQLFDDLESLSQKWDDVTCVFGGRLFKHKDRAANRKRDRWATGLDEEPNYAAPSGDELTRRFRKLVSGSNLPPVSPDPIIHPMQTVRSQGDWMVADMAALRAAAPPAQVKPLRTYGTKRWTLPEFEKQEQTAEQDRDAIEKVREHDKQRFRQAEADAITKADLAYFRARNNEAAAQISAHEQWECARRFEEQEQTRCDRQSFLRRLGSRIDAPMEVGQ